MIVNTNNAKLLFVWAIGVIVISNDVDAVRGIAKSGPIVKYMTIKNITENFGEILLKKQNNLVYLKHQRLPIIIANLLQLKQMLIWNAKRINSYLNQNIV